MEVSFILLNEYCIVTAVAQSVHRLLAHMREDATRQLHCQWRCGPCHAKRAEDAASVRQCCAAVTDRLAARRRPYLVVNRSEIGAVRWLQIRWNESIKHWVRVYKSIQLTFFACIFFQIYDKLELLNFQR